MSASRRDCERRREVLAAATVADVQMGALETVGEDGDVACFFCGCTENAPCDGGCFWSLPGVCSRCAARQVVERETARKKATRRKHALREANRAVGTWKRQAEIWVERCLRREEEKRGLQARLDEVAKGLAEMEEDLAS